MCLADILPNVQQLSRSEKLRLIQLLAEDLSRSEQSLLPANQSYPVWSPTQAFSAAETMLQMLKAEQGES